MTGLAPPVAHSIKLSLVSIVNESFLLLPYSQVPVFRRPVVRDSDCMLNLDFIPANENVNLNISDVHLINRNKCPKNTKSVNIFNQFKDDFNSVRVNDQSLLDAISMS